MSSTTRHLVSVFLAASLAAGVACGADAEKDLANAIRAGDLEKIEQGIIYLQGIGGTRPVEFLTKQLAALPKGKETIYWMLVRGLTGFGDSRGLEELADFLRKNRKKPVAYDIMFGLQGNTAPGLIELHRMVLDKCGPELAVMSAEQLSQIKNEEAVDALVTAFKEHKRNAQVRFALGDSLAKLTNQRFGPDGDLWVSWWSGAKGSLVEGTGYFHKEGDDDYAPMPDPVKAKVLVLTQDCPTGGQAFDRIQDVMAANGYEYELMQKETFNERYTQADFDIDSFSAILVNCTNFREHCHGAGCKPGGAGSFRMNSCGGPGPHDTRAHRLSAGALDAIKEFVADGGFLMTEDWGLIEITAQLYPDIIGIWPDDVEDASLFLREQHVDVNPVPGNTAHHLLRGVYQFHDVDDGEAAAAMNSTDASWRVEKLMHEWQIDNESPALRVRNKQVVTTLLKSKKVAALTGLEGACAVTFFPGKHGRGAKDCLFMQEALADDRESGRVLHILSHFTKQGDIEDERAVKRLLLNFVDESALAHAARERRKAANR